MQDRFKFRFYDKENKIMVYADTDDELLPYHPDEIYTTWQTYDLSAIGNLADNKDYIVMQSTGLKDKNGKLIYEGDIVKITREKWTKERYNRFYIVCWDRTQWQLGLIKYQRTKAQPNRRPDRKIPFKNIVSFADYTPLKEFALCKVMGNIYENPELLESN